MPNPEDTTNTSAGTGDEDVDTQAGTPDSTTEDANKSAETDVAEGKEADTASEGEGQDSSNDSFLDDKTKKSIDEYLVEHPEMKPYYDYLHKNMQGDYTRKRQRDSNTIKELTAKADMLKAIEGDPELVKLIQGFKRGEVKLTPAETKEAAGDVLDEWLKTLEPEEKLLVNRIRPGFEKMIAKALEPLKTVTEQTTEKTALSELSARPEFEPFDVKTYWDDVKAIKAKYKEMTYEEALRLAIGNDLQNISENLLKSGKETAQEKKAAKEPAKKKAGFVAGGDGAGTQVSDKPDSELSADEYAKKYGLKVE